LISTNNINEITAIISIADPSSTEEVFSPNSYPIPESSLTRVSPNQGIP